MEKNMTKDNSKISYNNSNNKINCSYISSNSNNYIFLKTWPNSIIKWDKVNNKYSKLIIKMSKMMKTTMKM